MRLGQLRAEVADRPGVQGRAAEDAVDASLLLGGQRGDRGQRDEAPVG
ncbi:MAG TPA: hypothetical protein VIS09_05870 [Streptomyces sp.]